MGLILNALQSLYVGAACVLMAPANSCGTVELVTGD